MRCSLADWMASSRCLLLLILPLTASLARDAEAQQVIARPERLPALGRAIASTDDTNALVLNPANLGFLPGTELRWVGTFLQERVAQPWQGHAFSYGLRLPVLDLATAVRADFVDPPSGVGLSASDNYQWLTWGLAFKASSTIALGGSLQRAFSDGAFVDGLTSYSLGLTTRPFNALGLSAVGSHINGPRNELGGSLGATYDFSAAIRPFGTRAFELGLEGKYLQDEEVWAPRGTVGVDIPYVGRLFGELTITDPTDAGARSWLASATLAVFANGPGNSSELQAGVVTGNALGVNDSYNLQTGVALRRFREPEGIPPERYAIRVRLEDTPDAQGHVALLRGLWSIAREHSIDAVVLELRANPGGSLAHVQELRDAVFHLRRHGKRVLCHLEEGSGAALYLCAAANQTYLNPAGGVLFAGLRTQYLYFGTLLEKLGVKAEFVRIGAHKSAPETFTRDGSTEVAKSDKIDLLQQFERQLTEGLALGRQLSFAQVRQSVATGPFVAREAQEAKLIDGVAFDDEIPRLTNKLVGRSTALLPDPRRPYAPDTFSRGRRIALVYIDGDMVDGRSKRVPLIGMRTVGSYTIAETLKAVREDPEVAGIVLRVETPGGSSLAADVIWREVQLTAKVKPIVVSMGSFAASGGYYVSASATRIFANPLTITGSIGIFAGKADVSALLSNVGINVETYKTSERADADSVFRPFTSQEREVLQTKIGEFYQTFLERVASGRKMSKDAVDKVGQGRVWTGEQAQQRGLVDEIGGLRQALDYVRQQTGLDDKAPIVELPQESSSLLARLLGIPGVGASTAELGVPELPSRLGPLLKALGPFLIHPADRPLARLEFTTLGPE